MNIEEIEYHFKNTRRTMHYELFTIRRWVHFEKHAIINSLKTINLLQKFIMFLLIILNSTALVKFVRSLSYTKWNAVNTGVFERTHCNC